MKNKKEKNTVRKSEAGECEEKHGNVQHVSDMLKHAYEGYFPKENNVG